MADPRTVSAKIFLSYRRQDSAGYTGRIFDRLRAAFGKDAVFHDVDSIRAGQDFADAIEATISSCACMLVMIGPDWLQIEDEAGQRRLDAPQDYVRLEVASALKRDVTVIPVLVGGAQMPRASDLPEELQPLARSNAIEIRHTRFDADIGKLVGALEQSTSLPARRPSRFVTWAQAATCVTAGVLSYIWPPPADLTAGGSRAAGVVAAIVLIAAAIVLALLRSRPRAGSKRWLTAAALVCLSSGIAAILFYQSMWAAMTTPYDSTPVVVGSEATPMTRQYLDAHPGTSLEQLVMDAGGDVEQLWTRDSIRRNVLALRTAHVATILSFAACILVFLRLIRLRR
jgi:hypothetical protein